MLAVRAVLRFALVAAAVVGAAMALWTATMPARAAPPPGVSGTGPVADWVTHWINNHPGGNSGHWGCCGLDKDCRPTAIRFTQLNAPSGYDAWIDKEAFGPTAPDGWVQIPSFAFTRHEDASPGRTSSEDNPTGVNWACWWHPEGEPPGVWCASLGNGI